MQQVRARHRPQEQLPHILLPTPSKQRKRKKNQVISCQIWIVDDFYPFKYTIALVGAIFSLVVFLLLSLAAQRKARDAFSQSPVNFLFPLSNNTTKFHKPTAIIELPRTPNFGDVAVRLFTNDGMTKLRRIYRNVKAERGVSADSRYPKSEKSFFDYIYNFDDDYLRSPLWVWDDDKIQDEKVCRRNAWHRRNLMDCNSLHELDVLGLMAQGKMKTLG